MSRYTEEADDIAFFEPVLAQKNVKMKISFVEHTEWESKNQDGTKNGVKFDACKLTLLIDDSTVRTEHIDAKPRLVVEDQFNIVQFPYWDKKTGEIMKLGRTKLYQLEEAFGFDPIFQVGGSVVEPYITKSGKKVAPKLEGVKRIVNPDFFNAYFTEDGRPIIDNWLSKVVYADIKLTVSEQFGSRNDISRYVKAPAI